MSSLEHIHRHAEHGDGDEDQNAPVERLQRDRGRAGPETPEKRKDGVCEAARVHDDAEATEAPASFGKKLRMQQTSEQHTPNRGGVGEHQRRELERYDGVEGGGGADVDQGEGDGY